MTKEEWERFWGLFHKAWGQCKASTEYDKPVWNEMQQMLKAKENKQ